ERAAGVGVPRRALVDAGDAVGGAGLGADQLEVAPEQADGDGGLALDVAGVHEIGVADVQLADELGDDVVDVLAGDAVGEHLAVLLAEALPVHAVHVLDVEEVALDAVDVVEDLLPLGAGVDPGGHAGGDDALAGGAGGGVLDGRAVAAGDQEL